MKIEFELSDVLTKEKMAEIAEDEMRYAIRNKLSTLSDFEILLNNSSYRIFWKLIDEAYQANGMDFKELLKNKIVESIDKLSPYSVFRDLDYGRKNQSVGQKMLDEIVVESRPKIESRVTKIIQEYNFMELYEDITDTIYEVIDRQLKGVANNDCKD